MYNVHCTVYSVQCTSVQVWPWTWHRAAVQQWPALQSPAAGHTLTPHLLLTITIYSSTIISSSPVSPLFSCDLGSVRIKTSSAYMALTAAAAPDRQWWQLCDTSECGADQCPECQHKCCPCGCIASPVTVISTHSQTQQHLCRAHGGTVSWRSDLQKLLILKTLRRGYSRDIREII